MSSRRTPLDAGLWAELTGWSCSDRCELSGLMDFLSGAVDKRKRYNLEELAPPLHRLLNKMCHHASDGTLSATLVSIDISSNAAAERTLEHLKRFYRRIQQRDSH